MDKESLIAYEYIIEGLKNDINDFNDLIQTAQNNLDDSRKRRSNSLDSSYDEGFLLALNYAKKRAESRLSSLRRVFGL